MLDLPECEALAFPTLLVIEKLLAISQYCVSGNTIYIVARVRPARPII